MIRPIRPEDAGECVRILFEAHQAIGAVHGYPPEIPSLEFAGGLIGAKLTSGNSHGFLAEDQGRITGSIFLNFFPGTPVAAIGPLSVDPAATGGPGRRLMEEALAQARESGYQSVRLLQSPSHLRSLALYTKSGFALREPLVLMHGPTGGSVSDGDLRVRSATPADIETCNKIATWAHGFAREFELAAGIEQQTATVVEHNGRIIGYATGLGFRAHATAETTCGLAALIRGASAIQGPGFFVPVRNTELLRMLLEGGFRGLWPAALMTLGPWQEARGAFLPAIAF